MKYVLTYRSQSANVKRRRKVVRILNYASHHEDVWGSGSIAPPFLTAALHGVVSFTHLPLYRRGKSPRYPFDRRLGGPQSRSGRCGGVKNVIPLPGFEPGYVGHPACSIVVVPGEVNAAPISESS
jgi:hypothetical protein